MAADSAHLGAPNPEHTAPVRLRVTDALGWCYLLTLPFDGVQVVGGRSLPFAVSVLFVGAFLVDVALGKATERFSSWRVPAAVLAITSYGLISFAWSLDPALTFTRVATQLSLIAVAVPLSVTLARRPTVTLAFVFGACLLSVLVLLAPPGSEHGRRTFSGDPNDVAVALATGAAVAMTYIVSRNGLPRVLGAAALLLMAVGILATGSRTGAVALAGVLILGPLVASRRRPARAVLALALTVGVSILVWTHLPAQYVPQRVADITQSATQDQLSGREELWSAILSRGVDLTGVGWGASPAFLVHDIGADKVSHNVVLGMMLELGIFGLLLWAWLIVELVRAARRSRHGRLAAIVTPVILTASMTLSLDGRRIFWFWIALAWAGAIEVRNAATKSATPGRGHELAPRWSRDHGTGWAR